MSATAVNGMKTLIIRRVSLNSISRQEFLRTGRRVSSVTLHRHNNRRNFSDHCNHFHSYGIFSQSPLVRNSLVPRTSCIQTSDIIRNFSISSLRLSEVTATTSAATETVAKAAEGVTTSAAAVTEATTATKDVVLDFIPDKPLPLEALEGFAGEPSLASMGLASWWPSGRFQYFMEQIHMGLDIPWWATIVTMTCIIRVCVFPLVVMAQKNAANLNNNMPKLQVLQQKMTDARRRGDMYETAAVGTEMKTFMTEKNINPLKNFAPIVMQLPIFMSMFFGLRAMSYLPVESMTSGGVLWFEDLTMADPFYVLPLLTSTTLYLQFYFAADGASLQQAGPIAKVVMKAMPFLLFPLTCNFPAAVTFYWFTTNIISVAQAKIVRSEVARNKLGIPKIIKWNKDKMPVKEKGFRESVRETIDNYKVSAEISDRRAFDEQMFREAGLGKRKRTYKYDPTKPIVRAKKN